MVRKLQSALLLSLLSIGASGLVHAQNEMLQTIYARLADSVRADYEALRAQLSHTAMQFALPAAKEREELKMLSYNKAVLFAGCAAESEQDSAPTTRRVPSADNLMLRTCVEIKFFEMEKFSNRLATPRCFFPTGSRTAKIVRGCARWSNGCLRMVSSILPSQSCTTSPATINA